MVDQANPEAREIDERAEECPPEREAADDRRLLCQFLLFVAAIFVINAMEEGSYRTPWPVAILSSIGAVALCAWFRFKKKS